MVVFTWRWEWILWHWVKDRSSGKSYRFAEVGRLLRGKHGLSPHVPKPSHPSLKRYKGDTRPKKATVPFWRLLKGSPVLGCLPKLLHPPDGWYSKAHNVSQPFSFQLPGLAAVFPRPNLSRCPGVMHRRCKHPCLDFKRCGMTVPSFPHHSFSQGLPPFSAEEEGPHDSVLLNHPSLSRAYPSTQYSLPEACLGPTRDPLFCRNA